ncbi:MAG TPA: hypothetical protein VHJ69_04975 [Gemmatimonadales bacterium]|jgi:hypothetical protein|nr:hypothetical protein [Gemmatimonadales bacterium]
MRRTVLCLTLLLLPPAAAAAQECRPPTSSNEAESFAIASVPLAFSAAQAPEMIPGLRGGLEVAYVPQIDDETATPTICRPGKGPENVNLTPIIPRPRLSVPLPWGLALEASWIPPIRVGGVKANLFGVSLSRPFGSIDGLVVALRGHATFGSIHAPITCDDDALGDPGSECFQGTRSDDSYSPNIFGADLAASVPVAGGRVRPYAGAGYNRLKPRFQVNFTNSAGGVDTTRVIVDLNRFAVFGGATWIMSYRLTLSGEVYATPADAVTARLVVRSSLLP